MGLLDNFSLDNLDDPRNQGLLAMGLSMITPKQVKTGFLGDLGQSGLAGLQTLNAAQQQERQNRANDIQQLTAASTLLRQQEFARMAAAQQSGTPYTPNPLTAQVNAKLGQLIMGPNLSKLVGKMPDATALSAAPPMAVTPATAAMGVAAPSQSVIGNSDYNPPQGAIRPNTPPTPPPTSSGLPAGFGGPAGGIPMSVWAASDPTGMAYLKQLAEDNKPITLRQGDLVARRPDGSYGSVYQQPPAIPGVLPNRDQNGQVQSFREAPGFAQAQGNIAAAKTTATKAAEAQFTPISVPGANRMVFLSQVSPYFQGGPNALPQPPSAASGQSQPPSNGVARVDVTEPSRQSQYGFQGNGLTGPDPVALAGATRNAETAAKNQQNVIKDDYQDLARQNVNAQTVISRLQTIKQLGPQAITGAEAEKRDFFNGLLSLVGVKSANDAKTASDLVDKNASQIALAIGTGPNGTDALRSLAQMANPNRHMTNEAIQKAADSIIAPLRMTQTKTQMLTPYFAHGDSQGYLQQKQLFEKAADPRVWELQNMPAADQRAYVQSLSPADAKDLLAKRQTLKQLGVLQ